MSLHQLEAGKAWTPRPSWKKVRLLSKTRPQLRVPVLHRSQVSNQSSTQRLKKCQTVSAATVFKVNHFKKHKKYLCTTLFLNSNFSKALETCKTAWHITAFTSEFCSYYLLCYNDGFSHCLQPSVLSPEKYWEKLESLCTIIWFKCLQLLSL